METEVLAMDKHAQFLVEALQKAISIVDRVEERYRDAALPIVLQSLIKVPEIADSTTVSAHAQNANGQRTLELRLLPNMSVNEFFRKAAPDSHPGRFVCAAYYLLHTGKAEQFTQSDILEIYGKLREPKPKNPADVISQCIRKAQIVDAPASADSQKRWVITPEGEKFVEGLLNGNTTGNKSTSR